MMIDFTKRPIQGRESICLLSRWNNTIEPDEILYSLSSYRTNENEYNETNMDTMLSEGGICE